MIQLGRFDQLGSGVTNIYKYLPFYANGAIPVFEETHNGFRLTIPLKKPAPEVTPEVTPVLTPEVELSNFSGEVVKMVEVIKGEMTKKEIMKVLSLNDEKHFREHYLQKALAGDLIEMTIADKPRSKNQKYRLTNKGHKLIKVLKK